ncbi:MAG: hypothetical protein IJ364_04645 [Oscillospiraceae bacterium]|nr:hypothetical protein [Oscillospiraceae bacterium]
MKKVLGLLLAMSMLFSLCGEVPANADSKTEIIAVPSADNKTELIAVSNADESSVIYGDIIREQTVELAEPLGDDNFVIVAYKTTFTDYETYTEFLIEIKVKNLTEYNPPHNYLSLYYAPIDANGDLLTETLLLGNTNISPSGRAQWFKQWHKEAGATGVLILGYKVFGENQFEGYFDTPIELYSLEEGTNPADDAVIISKEAENQHDIVVEDCTIAWEGKGYIAIKPKVHNCTDMDAAYLNLNCELIDKDGRTMRVASCDTGGIAAGANEWVSGIIQINNDEISELAELKFSGGAFDISIDGKCFRQTVTFAETSFTKEHVFGE